jgi:hypothetical protein
MGQLGRAVRSVIDLHDRLARGGIRREIEQRQGGVAGNDRQQIVEVVRDATGQHPQAFEFLRLQQFALQRQAPLLGALVLGDVGDRGSVQGNTILVVASRDAQQLRFDRSPPAQHKPHFGDHFAVRLFAFSQMPQECVDIAFGHILDEKLTDQARPLFAEQRRTGEVDLVKPPFVVEADRGQRGEVVEIRVAVARFFQKLLSFPQLAVLHLQLNLMNPEVVQQLPRSIRAVLLLERRPILVVVLR